MDKNRCLRQVFDQWNSYKGKSVCKRDKDGKETTVTWRTHKPKDDGSTAPDVRQAISEALKAGYSVKEITGAIDNYARILLSADYWWSHVWPLSTFLMVKYERCKDAEHKWWQFLPDNFDEGKYLTDAAKRNRVDQDKGPTPLQAVKEQIERQRSKGDDRKQTA